MLHHIPQPEEFDIWYRPPIDEVASIAVRNRIEELPWLEEQVLSLHFGVGCRPLEIEQIAERLDESIMTIGQALDRGLHMLGLRVITELAA